MNKVFFALLFTFISTAALAQIGGQKQSALSGGSIPADSLSYLNPKDYIIGDITVSGAKYLNKDVLLTISKLNKGDKINLPGEQNANVIKDLYKQGLFDDVQLNVTRINMDTIYLEIAVVERPRLSRLHITGIRKGEIEDVNKKLSDKTGKIVNENLLSTTKAIIKKHFNEKGYLNTTVTIKQTKDPGDENSVILDVAVDKKSKVKINSVTFEGNKAFSDSKLRKFLKNTRVKKFYNIFGSKKFKQDKYEEDKQTLIEKMQAKGYRDAEVVSDTVTKHDEKTVDVKIKVYEGPKYYFGKINFSGNARYATDILTRVLQIEKGQVFSEEELNKRLTGPTPNNDDVSSLYLNDGYLTFNADPVQTRIHNDTVDLDIRIYEGPQYTINRVILKGNDVTNDKVVMREIRTKPGQKFNKELLIRSAREIGQLGNFDEQKTEPRPTNINPADGTVDLVYNVVEKPSDQIELSGGFGGGQLVGTLGLTFNNFALRNLFNLKAYKPLPKGDGQKLSLRGQSSGRTYQNFSFTFSEPWLGGKKPIYFAVSAYTQGSSTGQYYAKTDSRYNKLRINGVGVTLGKRLNWPDNYFQLNYSLNFDHYDLDNYGGYLFQNGTSYNIKLTQELSRNSVDVPIYPTSGSNIKLTIQATPPYSLFNNVNYKVATPEERYHFVEYYKWKFDAQWFQRITGKLVLMSQVRFGYLGQYNKLVGPSPFERFKLGGDGMQSYQFLQGTDIIGLRGYENFSIVPVGSNLNANTNQGSAIYNKYTMELRHPVIASQSATIFLLAFAEGGNVWDNFSQFNPFNVRRSAGVGARIFLPIFGLLGLDYGYGFDKIPGQSDANKGHFHFTISQSLSGGFN
ncbi:outer membrane protein assembly factor BamA [Mucilaginibacter phyllosphaerae]|uniref:Outer membrane protein assembly factor BamA n=1 Tax=Mucilaginibacter phyllosphaerae TaxID=1812349 RepID=A0A4Y8AJH8_9SPHI|nr:outer membrane protein assembly factor BamA [Mucilaginibacter phyllosphaerae]MBB3967776.1 outer membrane protein insertion porin family [Mucilaginibacter phyllosphaerae]TEW69176.1 outer membrane protein assembly factor BamA [Mucilaginibacter phyllosphaerae]GGH03415.1 outer membrane protein assembly factor [Mucilaginibacter phyllosphaerae]